MPQRKVRVGALYKYKSEFEWDVAWDVNVM